MKLLFIRHAKALSRDEWHQDDLLRPLSEDGIKKAKSFFKKFPLMFQIDVIISSKAVRAVQTAKLLQEVYPNAKYYETSRLNPGASPLKYEEIIERFRGYHNVAFVGHEPDISQTVSHLIGCEEANIHIKKGSVTLLQGDHIFELTGMIYPKLLRHLEC
ncbi:MULTISPECIES: histidine phosphatase family protein [unclassified Nitratiruptor]|uniref:SixA phosphatase family protein n=1 Tax=unclassified Nitratiruptor TaxID=2624044 RepID=UPI001916BA7A|nr:MULTISPECIES: phosphoglycerate mutase family protein [unclassified Nitratiruptor]BCD60130.1 phosphohistidine phosphatase [Nitratiruptor sp. YY08-10]BCD64381.1 phosphohistidine phosphatase [Nitratiruptor sp. YY08-14]